MNLQDPFVLKKALWDQDLRTAVQCINAGQNPMLLEGSRYSAFYLDVASKESSPEFLSLLALRKRIDLHQTMKSNNAFIPATTPLVKFVISHGYIKNLHLLIQAHVILSSLTLTNLFTLINPPSNPSVG